MRFLPLLLFLSACASAPRAVDSRWRMVQVFDGCGLGWMAAPDLIVTNRHVADCLLRFRSGELGPNLHRGHVLRRGAGFVDLAVVQLTRPLSGAALGVLAARPVHVGEELLGYAAPSYEGPSQHYAGARGLRWHLRSYRVVARPERVPGGLDGVIVAEGQAHRGQSGGPAFNGRGEVVGTFYAATRTHAYIVPVRPYLEELLPVSSAAVVRRQAPSDTRALNSRTSSSRAARALSW